ncbi:protein SanA, affects membrane permeability for vancomycin [Friedmanniella luteola]|uniref:Protein SanA, affects membrane permeability for vancomycin n=1 Tax=Friedmanniella luteola TaxID=546871 RepID=A0A1H1ZX97_9ACTN|nr:ElyC/SanA/YdcF family protein [Friedmanniella luteola]SDT38187.1 protein SanA, affects membrane permeability for vancomycin [Friedmanniella luteola]
MIRLPVLVRTTGGLLPLGAAAAVLASVGFVRWQAAGHLHPEAAAPTAPVALVLGAQVYPSGVPSSFLAARLDLARRLLEAGRVQVLLLSGDGAAPEYDEPAAMRRHLLAAGVPDDRMVLDPFGLDTYDSCVRAARVYGVEELLVVTQSYHLPRAVATARALGLAAEGVGDVAVRRLRPAYVRGLLRDQVACVKTVVDLATRRQPVLGPADPAVREALRH